MRQDKSERLYRASQLHIEQPKWGRRRINAQLRIEFGPGGGLRDAIVDKVTLQVRQERKAGLTPEFTRSDATTDDLQQRMKEAGFLPFEIFGGVDSIAKPLGDIAPDTEHMLFRHTMTAMIRGRREEHEKYLRYASDRGWGRAKTTRRWNKRINSHYAKGKFPTVGKSIATGGRYVTPDGKPSPWALYKAWEARLIKGDPFGVGTWGDTPRARSKGVGKKPIVHKVSPSKTRAEIKVIDEKVRQLKVSITRQRAAGNTKLVVQHIRQIENLKETKRQLEDKL